MIGDKIDKIGYPQLPAMLRDELGIFPENSQFSLQGYFTEEGTSSIILTFYLLKDGKVLIAAKDSSGKVRSIKKSKKGTVLVDPTDVPFKGV